MKNSNHCVVCNFEYSPKAKLLETSYWRVDLLENQAYLGRAIVSLNRHAENLSELTSNEWEDLKDIINRLEAALKEVFQTTSFNWTALMNDAYKAALPKPHVHFHMWPRYRKATQVSGENFSDPNFAHHYDTGAQHIVSDQILSSIHSKIKQALKLDV